MNREIKFRVWDDRLNNFNYFDLLSVQGNLPHDCLKNIQQFIGLYDKNNKEIYEGDIVRLSVKDDRGCAFDMKGEIRYETFEWVVLTNDSKWPCVSFAVIDTMNVEIIGNIYENPELLG